ncbi:MAG: hypothetical protein AB1414_03330 [bacterium]
MVKWLQITGYQLPITSYQSPVTSIGAEYVVKKAIALRAGYKSGPQDKGSGLTAGFGISWCAPFSLDYAYQPYDELGNSHYVSLQIRF